MLSLIAEFDVLQAEQVCGDGWFMLCALICQCYTDVDQVRRLPGFEPQCTQS